MLIPWHHLDAHEAASLASLPIILITFNQIPLYHLSRDMVVVKLDQGRHSRRLEGQAVELVVRFQN